MSEWDKFKETKLRSLWASGASLKEIGIELGFSETATRSKVRRMNLAPRVNRLKQIEDLKAGECKWPLGDPKKPGFGFCAKATADKLYKYCPAHIELGTEKKVG